MSTTPPRARATRAAWSRFLASTLPARSTRRGWLGLAAAGSALAGLGSAWWAWRARRAPRTLAEVDSAMVERIVDILVPRDDAPGAVELGVPAAVLQVMQERTVLALSFGELFAALDRAARTEHAQGFLALETARQDALLQVLSHGGPAIEGWSGLMQLRELTLQLYYAQPQAWPALGLTGAPQPVGFMDYADPPRPRG
jgi:hypothetical protein